MLRGHGKWNVSLQVHGQEEWKPLALMVAEFEASTPARFNHGPRAVQYVPPPQPDPGARVAVSHWSHLNKDSIERAAHRPHSPQGTLATL